jgi:integrase
MNELLTPKRIGYWDKILGHIYHRLSVEKFIEEFCGWKYLLQLIGYAGSLRNKAFLSVLFQTGGRILEVLPLTDQNFIVREDEGVILVRGMKLEKRYRKNKKTGKTETINAVRRQFPIRLAEPLSPILLEWLTHIAINTASNQQQPNDLESKIAQSKASTMISRETLLFPSPYTNEPLTRSWAYKWIRQLDQKLPWDLRENLGLNVPFIDDGEQIADRIHLWLHWFRSQRASQLVRDYGFEVIDLLKYFSWQRYETAVHYAQKGWKDLAGKMQTAHVVYT